MARQFLNTLESPIVETKNGKLRGFQLDGIYAFYGIHYAEAERWQAPTPVEPWEGIQNATNYGYICPVAANPAPTSELYIPHRFWPSNEHCQNLNVWTPGINDGKKRPVMVWFHGGGFSDGSGIEQVAYEGDKLAEYGDVVVVTVSHRLNILGYLDMSSFGEKYANSVNAGIADLVASLQWVHDNIEAFGGDPENVTIFGQSGGGSKVKTLLNTPAADGLFQKGIMMSGGCRRSTTTNKDHREIVLGILKTLGIAEENVEELETVPYDVLIRAYTKVAEEKGNVNNMRWGPVANDWYVGDPYEVGFTEHAKTVPVMVGTVLAEFTAIANAEK
jgi:para-nitrobenzyl esterase